jgi:hypothetical protein
MRELTKHEQRKLEVLTENSVSVALIEPTKNGLKKSIMDATGSVRNYLLENSFHDYTTQRQGPDHKIMIDAALILAYSSKETQASLYRPKTKKGDPRIWFSGLPRVAEPNDILALIGLNHKIYVINLTQLPVEELVKSPIINPLQELVQAINLQEGAIARELLTMLRKMAMGGPIAATVNADTAVGRTLETALGIEINSSKKPDYKGIELKSYRDERKNRKNLFAQVADWELSKLKSSAAILDAFGYWREENFKLYCTVRTTKRNSQGLQLKIDNDINQLFENSDLANFGDFAVWQLEKLHERLLEKHNETFWIGADSLMEDGKEYFQYKAVEHTRKPIVSQFDILLEQGIITMDHLIKRDKKGRVVEKGPLFKLKPNCLDLLFPPSKKYDLME